MWEDEDKDGDRDFFVEKTGDGFLVEECDVKRLLLCAKRVSQAT